MLKQTERHMAKVKARSQVKDSSFNETTNVTTEYQFTTAKGLTLTPGDMFRIAGERGQTFSFISYSHGPKGEWISGYGGVRDLKGQRGFRAFRTDADIVKAKR